MKKSIKKVLSLALAGAIALTSVFAGNAADARTTKKAGNVPTAKMTIQAAADKAVSASTVVTLAAVSTASSVTSKSVLTCTYDAKLSTSIASASAVVASGNAVKVTVTATKGAVAATDAAVNVLANNQKIANVLVTIKAAPVKAVVKKATKSIAFKKKQVIIAKGKSKNVAYTIKKTAAADQPKDVKVTSSKPKAVKAKLVSGKKKVKISVTNKAVLGDSANVTIKSGNKTSVLKVYVKNVTKKVTAKKSTVSVKKNAKAKVTVTIKAANPGKKTTDKMTVTSSNKKVVAVKKAVVKKGKGVITLKAKKVKGSSKLTVKVGKKSKAMFVYVR